MNPQLQISIRSNRSAKAAHTRSASAAVGGLGLGTWAMAYCPEQGLDFGGFGRMLATVPSALSNASKDRFVSNTQEGSL